jgi:tetratricopeptide (TPR) repeat protein
MNLGRTLTALLITLAIGVMPVLLNDAAAASRAGVAGKSKFAENKKAGAPPPDSENYQTERKVAAQGLRERTHKRLTRVHELIGEEKYAEAMETIQPLLDGTKGLDYEYAVVLQTMGHIYASQGDYAGSINVFKEAVAMDVLPNHSHFQLMLVIAQLYIVTERFREGLQYLDIYFGAVVKAPPNAWELKAIAHAQLEELRPAIEAIKMAIALSNNPKENWYQLLLGLHYQLKEYPEAAEVLEILIAGWPEKKDYWVQLSGLYVELKKEDRSLAVLALAHAEGLLDKEKEWLSLVNLYMYKDVPFTAAQVVAQGLEIGVIEPTKKNYELLGNAWYQAQELDLAIEAYRQAAKLWDEDGKMDLQAAYLLVEKEAWAGAEASLAEALRKGKLKDMGNVYVLMGMTSFELGRNADAKNAFREARKFPKSADAAREWLNHIEERESKAARQVSMAN